MSEHTTSNLASDRQLRLPNGDITTSLASLRETIRASIADKKWPLALERATQLVEKFPQHLQGYVWQGRALIELGQYEQAEAVFKYLTTNYSEKVEGWRGLSQVSIRRHQWPLALERATQLVEKFPQHLQGYVWQGIALIELGQYEQAEAVFKYLTTNYSEKVEGWRGLSQVSIRRHQWPLVLERAQAIIEKFPDVLFGYTAKANALLQLEDADSAESLLTKAIALMLNSQQSGKFQLLQALITVASHTLRWNLVLEQVDQYLKDSPSLVSDLSIEDGLFRLLNRLVDQLLATCKLQETESLINQLVACDAPLSIVYILKSKLAYEQNKSALAQQLCFEAIQHNPTSADWVHLQLARYARSNANLKQTLRFCKQIQPSDSPLYMESVVLSYQVLIRLERTDEAQRRLRQLIRWHPHKPQGYAFLAEILCFYKKDYNAVLKLCNRAVQNGVVDERIACYKVLALAALGRTGNAIRFANEFLTTYYLSNLVLMAKAQALRVHQKFASSIKVINQWLEQGDFCPISSTGSSHELNIQYLKCQPSDVIHADELISVIMTTYKYDEFLPLAISSILNQTYQKLELIIVDDCSPDDNLKFLQEIAKSDSRIRCFQLDKNSGTYVAKNHGIFHSKGQYISLMDSDDWLHPQTLERQIEALQTPETMAVMCGFFRVDKNSNIEFKPEGPTGQAHITLCFKRNPVLNTIGYFDAVRTGADTEHLERLQMVFGSQALKRLKFPLLVSTRHEQSITGGGDLGFSWYGPGILDMTYAAAFRKWHRHIRQHQLSPYLEYPLEYRRFDVPEVMLT